jgi:thioesterase domain-containing protein/aryl carrier-like protein
MNTLTRGAWALLLSRHCQSDDVVFGATVSGRPADLAGVESIVGSFMNNLPVRIELNRETPISEWLQGVQAQQIAMQPYEYVAPAKVQSWSDVPNQAPLFDTLVIFQAPITMQADSSQTIKVTDVKGDVATIYPFTLSIFGDGDQLQLWATFDSTQIGEPVVEKLLIQLTRLFETIADNVDRSVGEMLDLAGIEPLRLQPIQQPGNVPHLSATAQSTPAVAFRNDTERRLTGLWETILGISPIGVQDNFFEMGGTSLQAMQLMSQFEKVTGRKLSLAGLFQAPTIEQLSLILHEEGWEIPNSSLVAIQPNGVKPPLYFIPGNFGNVFTDLGHLARHLDPDQPIYGLQDTTDTPSEITAMAERYVEQIRAFQSEGPYLLGGICSGGLVAYEMAQQLQREGQSVAFLALVEIFAEEANVRNRVKVVKDILFRLFRRLGYTPTHDGNQEKPQTRAIRRRELRAFLRLKAKVVTNMLGVAGYSPKPYDGRIDVFLTDESLAHYEPHLRWSRYATGGAETHKLPGTHASVTGDNVEISEAAMEILARQLSACIDAALEEKP